MRKLIFTATIAAIVSCNSTPSSNTQAATDNSTTSPAVEQDVAYAYPINYSSKFTTGDPKNSQAVLNIWKAFDNGDLASAKDYFADSVEMHFSDGSMIHSVRDSVIAEAQSYRNTLSAVSSSIDAVTAIKSIDQDENWALVWGMEKETHKDGKIDSVALQETWRFNKDGKADLMFQFAAKRNPPKK
ncbi:MAG TPA: nuclear transport factor 2 family protein [Parafilimonas sp.]|nr:nuclear transport factor 2 family protein [Parafilimonas sp.]